MLADRAPREIAGSCALCTGESDSILEEAASLMWYRRRARRRGWYCKRGGEEDEERGASEDREITFCGMLRIGMVVDWLVFGEEEEAVRDVDVEDERLGFWDTEDTRYTVCSRKVRSDIV